VLGAPVQLLVNKALKNEFLVGVETTCHTKSGLALPVNFSASAMHGGAGTDAGVVCVAQDISRRKETEGKMENLQKELLESSRQAGMAELATSVLHNVGNVLTSVNVASSLLADSLRKSRAANLSKVVAMIKEREADLGNFLTNDPKGKQIPIYLASLAEHLIAEQAGALKELAQLQKNIEHIKEIVSMQQNLAKASGATEVLKVNDLVEDALQMNAAAFARHKIQIVKELAEVPPLTTQKHKVLQILVNLLRNAKQACDASGRQDKQLTIQVSPTAECVRVVVADNGIGIPPENLERIFTHGFTTKKDGHGFGLHSGVQVAKELGGALTAHSDGLGHGATFTLELPLRPVQS
jgi:signal transduction histidine kinase